MASEDPVLIEPAAEWEEQFRAYAADFEAAREPFAFPEDFSAYVKRLRDESEGRGLPNGYVPCDTFWLVCRDGSIVGESSLRHRLTPALEDCGGHIGYAVRPSARRKGYGTRLLALTLQKAEELGLRRVLITCAPTNAASARIIEKNGGRLASEDLNRQGRPTLRFWIDL